MQKTGVEIEKLPPLLSLARVAEIAGVSRRTIRRWAQQGLISRKRMILGGNSKTYFETRDVMRALGVEVSDE